MHTATVFVDNVRHASRTHYDRAIVVAWALDVIAGLEATAARHAAEDAETAAACAALDAEIAREAA